MGVPIRKGNAEDAKAASEAFGAAFQDDPVNTWWIDDAPERVRVLPSFFRFAIERIWLPYDEVHIADDGAGVAAWLPPAEWRLTEEKEAELAPHFAMWIGADHLERGATLFRMVEEHHPEEPAHWYLPCIGVRPERQGQGIGSALLRHMTARFDREGVPAYLEASSERNRDLYLRHGFGVTGEIRLPDGPAMWLMWREPRGGA